MLCSDGYLYNHKKILSYITPAIHNKSHCVIIMILQTYCYAYFTFKYPAKSLVNELIHRSQLGVDN